MQYYRGKYSPSEERLFKLSRSKVESFVQCKRCFYLDRRLGVGVKETSRLISRIKNRQFGVLITTSVVGRQPYKEIRSDGHPVIFLTGIDIIDV